MQFIDQKIRVILQELRKHSVTKSLSLDGFVYKKCGYKQDNVLPEIDGGFTEFKKGDRWGGEKDTHFWFYKKLTVPCDGMELSVRTGREGLWDAENPQFIVYVDGEIVQALDVNHTSVPIAKAGEYELYLYAYAGMTGALLEFWPSLVLTDRVVEQLYYDLIVPLEICDYLTPEDREYQIVLNELDKAVNLLDLRAPKSEAFYRSVQAATEALKTNLYEKHKNTTDVTTVCIGHTHIDIAWMWTIAQTREKAVRSFSTVVSLMERYPEYKFMSSQAVLFKYVKEDAPELYEKIKKLVAQGRFEIEGAMWVEADSNLSGGESLVRQILFGKRFFKEEFDVDCETLWLPDVFGYSAAMPQILRKCGVDKFVTSKISWNEVNRMPNDTFTWQGIDGTEIFTYFLTAQDKKRNREPVTFTTYNAQITPAQIAGTYERFQNKLLSDETLLTFGYGDGGGGPTKETLEYGKRLEGGLPGCPKAKIDTATNFLNRLKAKTQNNPQMPKWVGELYLEFHRGTYTTMAKNKRNNRKSEFLFRNLELFSVVANRLKNAPYRQSEINEYWELILVNQFHDIIPGSSIKEVYDDSDKDYEKIFEFGTELLTQNTELIKSNLETGGGVLVFNPNPFENSGVVDLDGEKMYVEGIPALGYKVVQKQSADECTVSPNSLENSRVKVVFDEKYNLVSVYDKQNGREALSGIGNELRAFEDFPRNSDAWDITGYYKEKMWVVDQLESVEDITLGVVKGKVITRKFQKSTIVQKVLISPDSARVDIDTYIDWCDEHILLKAAFPLNVHSNKAVYDIQFGTVERPTHENTSWDQARFEVCAHKFADISEPDFGVSILNDCKYGYDALENTVSLSLLRSPTYPNPEADKGEHHFVYAIYPHSGDYRSGGTAVEAYKLNNPMTALLVGKQSGTLGEEYSFASIDAGNVFIESVKKAEDNESTIIRCYENNGSLTKTKITFGFEVKSVCLTDMMENKVAKIPISDNSAELTFKPFEIVTISVN